METQAYLTPEQGRVLEEATTRLVDQVLVRLHRRMGCRVGEILGIAAEDFNFDVGLVTIIHEKTHIRILCPSCKKEVARKFKLCPYCGKDVGEAIEKALKSRKVRTIPIDQSTVKLVQHYLANVKLPAQGRRHMLFPFNRQRAYQIITEAAARAGLPKIVNTESGKVHKVSSHRLRDAFAVNAVKKNDSGDGLRMLQEHLGHQNIGTTMRYRKVSGEELKQWYDGVVQGDE